MKNVFYNTLAVAVLLLATLESRATIYYTISSTTYSLTFGGTATTAPDYSADTIYYYHNVTLSASTTFNTCSLIVTAGKTLTLQGGGNYNFNSTNILVESTGTIYLNNAKFYYNSGVSTITGNLTYGYSNNDQIINAGTIIVTPAYSTPWSTLAITNSGTLTFEGNYTRNGSGNISNTGTLNFNGSFTRNGAGNLSNSGTINFNNDFTITSGTGIITNSGTINFNGNFTKNSSGDITNTGTINAAGYFYLSNHNITINNSGGGIFNVVGEFKNSSNQTTIINDGEISLGSMTLGNAFYLTNNTGADFAVTGSFASSCCAVNLTNSGEMEFNAMTVNSWPFTVTNNTGGTANFNDNIVSNGSSNFTNSGDLNINGDYASGGSFTMNNQSSGVLAVNGNLNLANTNFTNAGELNGSGTINYTSGTVTNTGTINGAAGVSVSNPIFLPAIPDNGTSTWTTYNGTSYSNGTPSCASNLNLTGNLTISSDLSAKRLVVGRGVTLTIESGKTFEACDNVVNDGTIIIENGGSLLESGSGENSGSGTYTIRKTVLAGANTVNFISSPISACSTSVMNSNPCDIYMWDPIIQYYSFDYPSGYVGNCNGVSVTFSGAYSQADGDNVMNPCRGYGVKTGSSTTKTFSGTANNGTLNYTIYTSSLNNASGWSGDDWNLVGNPYPSALNLTTFLSTNASSITGGAYLWDDDGTAGTGYTSSDYFVYNGSGSSTSPNSGKSFDGKLNSGVAFWVQANDVDAPGGDTYSLVFDNSMRVSGSNNDDFKQTETNNRIWLELRKDTNYLSSTLVAFIEGATDALDNLYDAKRENAGNPFFINSKLGNTPMVIQGMHPVSNFRSKTIPLQVVTPIADTYRIYCGGLEKSSEKFVYYLIDVALNTTTLLSSGVYYEFVATTSGTIDNRFYLKVENRGPELIDQENPIRESLQSEQITDSMTSVQNVISNSTTTLNCIGTNLQFSSESPIQSIEIFDLMGRRVVSYAPASTFGSITLSIPNGVYIAKYKTADNQHGSKKIVVSY